MYVAVVPNRGSRPAILLRESYRDGAKVKNRTLANLSDWPPEQIEALRGDKLVLIHTCSAPLLCRRKFSQSCAHPLAAWRSLSSLLPASRHHLRQRLPALAGMHGRGVARRSP